MGKVPTLEEFDVLWNTGEFHQARELLYGMNRSRYHAQYWLKRAMAELMFRRYDEAESCMREARVCSDWQPGYESAYKRDLALAYIRDPKAAASPREIAKLLEPMESSTDPNERACREMIMGRAYYQLAWETHGEKRRTRLDAALDHFAVAEGIWNDMGSGANHQWQMNNTYHWFKALRLKRRSKDIAWGLRRSNANVLDLYQRIMQDPNRRRRLAAMLILPTGRIGLWLERHVS